MILFDTNVLVAAAVEGHPHRPESLRQLDESMPSTCLVAAHSLAETFAVLTKRGPGRYGWSGSEAVATIESLTGSTRCVTLRPDQLRDALLRFAMIGAGPRVYDYLIGYAGEIHGATTIVTWDIDDMRALFPHLDVRTP